jgi:hypothetical protein
MNAADVSMQETSFQQDLDAEYDLSDPVIKEIDVYLAKSMLNSIYVLQVKRTFNKNLNLPFLNQKFSF